MGGGRASAMTVSHGSEDLRWDSIYGTRDAVLLSATVLSQLQKLRRSPSGPVRAAGALMQLWLNAMREMDVNVTSSSRTSQ